MLEDGIAYVDINTFGDNTTSELQNTLNTLLAENPRGIIIDLRNNGGGYLHTSVEVASEFIADGVVLYEQYGDGRRDVYDATGNGQITGAVGFVSSAIALQIHFVRNVQLRLAVFDRASRGVSRVELAKIAESLERR